ncbi:hypothetical protein HY312_03395, partial [Candidatus Saccharibacteria bacterium]|nr:hypothetical protein [Candidatus Saccharibacteria bacterium]
MVRLPQPGADNGNWGTILNEYLLASHKSDGMIKDNAVGEAQLQDGVVSTAKLAPGSVTSTILASNSVSSASIAAGTITKTLLSAGLQSEIDAKITQAVADSMYCQ